MRRIHLHDDVDYFFRGETLQALLERLNTKVDLKVSEIPEGQFLAASDEQLLEHLLPGLVATPIELHDEQKELESSEVIVEVMDFGKSLKVKGVAVDVSIPYSGGQDYWNLSPSTTLSVCPRGYIEPSREGDSGVLHIVKEHPHNHPIESLKSEIEHEILLVRSYLEFQRAEIDKHNKAMLGQIKWTIQARRSRLKIHKTIPNILGIPLKRKDGAPNFEPVGIKRKLIRPLPAAPKHGAVPEPGIAEPDYQHILAVIRHEGCSFETMPRTYAVHDEEELRDIMLAHLNGHYDGGASGEAFRKYGRTDIKIEDRERAAFIGECKIWRGSKELTAAIDQMLGYLTWRDCKAALVIFNKDNAKFSEILTKIPEALKSHPKFKGELTTVGRGEWKVQLSSSEDENRLITVTVFAFNLFVQP